MQGPTSLLARFLSLPRELWQSLVGSIANFEPWSYTSIPKNAGADISFEELQLFTRDVEPINLMSTRRSMLGLSSEDGWLVLVLSRHPYHLSHNDRPGISPAITQALRRMNTRLEQNHWTDNKLGAGPSTRQDRAVPRGKGERHDNPARQTASMKHYHASIHAEEECWSDGNNSAGEAPRCTAPSNKMNDSTSSALVVHRQVPVLKITGPNLISFATSTPPADAIELVCALLVAILIKLAQCRTALLETLERLERDTPILSVEPHEPRDIGTSHKSLRHDRLRSMSGSTVAEPMPHGEILSLSTISTVYSTCMHSDHKQVKCAEKRGSEEKDVGTSPKRPKLTEYRQVSSGRVATLMDRFEKFHL